jgi:hypothetical protein
VGLVLAFGCSGVPTGDAPPGEGPPVEPPPVEATAAALVISPTEHDFGVQTLGSVSGDISFTVSNTGDLATGTIAVEGNVSSDFVVVSSTCTGTLAAKATCTVVMHYAATTRGPVQAQVALVATPGGRATVTLLGSGLAPAELTLAPSSYDFGNLLLGGVTGDAQFTVTNAGDVDATGVSLSTDGPNAGDFSVSSSTCAEIVPPLGSCTVSVHYSALTRGAVAATLAVAGGPSAQLTAVGQAAASLSVDPSENDFGPLPVGVTGADTLFTVTNSGDIATGPLAVGPSGAGASQFVVASSTCGAGLDAQASCAISVYFAPGVSGAINASLELSSPGATTSVPMTGFGQRVAALSISNTALDFIVPALGVTGVKSLFITNTGDLPTTEVVLTELSGAELSVVSDACNGNVLAGQQSCEVVLAYAPTTLQTSGNFSASSDALVVASTLSGQVIPFQAGPLGSNGTVQAIVHAGNAWYLGGSFSAVNPFPAPRFIALDASTALPAGCDPLAGFDNQVNVVLKQGASLYIGGAFLRYQKQALSGGLVKIDPTNCTLDATFLAGTSQFIGSVNALVTDGTSLYVGGQFRYDGVAVPARNIAKIDLTSGALDTTFSPQTASSNGFLSAVSALVLASGSLYVGGEFNNYRGTNDVANRIAKLNPSSGDLDVTFSPPGMGANGFETGATVFALAASGTSIYVGGAFTAYRGVPNSALGLAKLDQSTGELDTNFSLSASGFNAASSVRTLLVGPSGLYAGGQFSSYRGQAANNIAKLSLSDGTLDPVFSPPAGNGTNGRVAGLALAGNALYVGGGFSTYRTETSVGSLVKVDASSGALDTSFAIPGFAKGFALSVGTIQHDSGVLYLGGSFTSYSGYLANNLAKIDDTTFKIDLTFTPVSPSATNGTVQALVASADSLYVGGLFTSYRGDVINRIAKLDLTSGVADPTFSPPGNNGFGGQVRALALDGTDLYVAGGFSAYRGVANSALRLAKLNAASGVLDETFSPPGAGNNGFNGASASGLAVLGSSVYVTGDFTAYRGVAGSASRLAKLDTSSGTLDDVFGPSGATNNGFDSTTNTVVAAGTSIYVGGSFSAYRGVAGSATRLAKLDATTGAIDATFSPVGANGVNAAVNALHALGGALYVGGSFTAYRGVAGSAFGLAKIDLGTGVLDATFSPPGLYENGVGNASPATVSVLSSGNGVLAIGGTFASYRDRFAAALAIVSPATGDAQ